MPKFATTTTTTKTTTTTTKTTTTTTTTTTHIATVGIIEHRDYINDENVTWIVNPACADVRIRSTFFDTESDYDYLFLNGKQFSGSLAVDEVLSSPFDIRFTSDESTTKSGFSLAWECLPCGRFLIVASSQKSTAYTGRYTYIGEFNGAPHYSQDNGERYLYRATVNDKWHFFNAVDSPNAVFYSTKINCPSSSLEWHGWDSQQEKWLVVPGFTVTINKGTYQTLFS